MYTYSVHGLLRSFSHLFSQFRTWIVRPLLLPMDPEPGYYIDVQKG